MKTMLTKMMKIAAVVTVAAGATLSAYAEAVTDTNDVTSVVVGWERAQEALGEQLTAAPASVREYSGLGGTGTYYVVSLEGGGYVVTSGDTSLEPVLAYSKTGTWVDDVKRNPLMAMLEIDIAAAAGLAERSSAIKSGGLRLAAGGTSATAGDGEDAVATQNAAKWARYKAGASKKGGIRLGASAPNSDLRVSPLIQSAWSQNGPRGTGPGVTPGGENYYTPGNVYCGCVATMAAQMMKYWEWPKNTNITAIANYYGSVIFVNNSYGTAVTNSWSVSEGFPDNIRTKNSSKSQLNPAFGGTYDWANMPLTTQSSLTDAQKAAIGKLTRDAGIACCMGYSNEGSGASGSILAHRAADQFAYTSGQDVGGWNDANRDALLACLDAGIPCGIAVSHSSSGHAIIADGYGYNSSGTLYVHFNYGWGSTGPSDWYTPPSVGDYNSVNDIIVNVYPPYVSKYDRTIVSGRVFSNGSVQSSVTVTATNRETGFSTNVTSNSKGIYSFMLPRGYYTFSATKNGSTAKVEADVKLGVAGAGSNAKSGNIHGLDLNLGTSVTAPSVALAHRWSFTGNLNDSVGGSNASTIGSNVNLVDGKAVCTGNGAAQGSLNLGSNLLDTDGATIEIWAANDEVKSGSRIFEYGVNTSHYFMMAWTKSTDLYVDCAEAFSDGANNIYDGTLAPFTLGRQYHIAVTFERQGDGTTKVRATRRDAASGAIQRVAVYSVTNGIHTFSSPILRLGRSFQGNADARATYDEVRVWQGVLSDAQLKASALAGPDANLSTLPWNASAVRYVAKAIWQGGTTAPTASSLASSANWSCTDQNGDAITGVPDHRSVVIIPNGSTAFTIPEGFTPNWRKLQIGSEGKATAQWGKKTYTQTSVSAQLDPTSADYTLQGDANVDELARAVAPSVQDAPAGLSGKQFRYDGWVYVTAVQAGRWAVSAYADDYAAFRLDDEWLAFTRVMDDGIRTAVADVPKGWHRFTIIIGDYYGGFGGCAVPTDHSCATPVTISIDGGNSIAFTSSNFQFGAPDGSAQVITLSGDCDWSGIGEVSLDSGAELDLNGHTLTIDKMDSSFLGANIKDTSATPGTIAFAEGGAVNSGNITVQSNVKTAYANAEALITAEAALWLDASDMSTITTNTSGEVTRWNSRVGSNYATQGRNYFAGSAFLYPTYDATTYGIPTVDFGNAVQSGWDNSNPGRDLNINTPVTVKTVFFVTRIQNDGKAAWLGQEDAAAYTSNCFRRDENGAYNDKRSGQPGQSRFANFWIGTDVISDMTTEHPPADRFCVFSAQMDDAGTYEAQHLAEQCGGLHSGGKQLSELIIFNRALSDAERTEVTRYLQKKWFAPEATLTHRWSFNGSTDEANLTDSVGGAVGWKEKWPDTTSSTHTQGGNVTFSNGKAVIGGGGANGYLNLGTGLLGNGDGTIEIWLKKIFNGNVWCYLFTFGQHDTTGDPGLFTMGNSRYNDTTRMPLNFRVNSANAGIYGDDMGLPLPVGMSCHVSLTFKSNGSGGMFVRCMFRDCETGFILKEQSCTVNNWTLANATEWALTLGHNPWVNSNYDVNSEFDEVRCWNGVLSDDQLTAGVIAGPDTVIGGGIDGFVIDANATFVVPTAGGGYGYKTDSIVSLGVGSKIRFDTTGYFGKGLRFKSGGFILPSGSVLDFVELSDTANYAATMEDANTILVQLKSTIPYESTWSGAAPSVAADLANAANWTSVNAQGATISAAPTAKTTVILPASVLATFSVPEGATANWGRILLGGHTKAKYGFKDGSPVNSTLEWRDLALSSYTTVSDIPNGKNDISYVAKSSGNVPSEVGTAQIRLDGWFYVTAAQAGKWTLPNKFDDVNAFAIDGQWLYLLNTYRVDSTGGAFVSEGWHRYTLVVGDTGGGWGSNFSVGGSNYPFGISINGAASIAFNDTNFTFGNDSDTVTLSQDCDWRALGSLDFTGGLTIDLNGHALAVTDITRSSLGASIVNNSETAASVYVDELPSASMAQASGMVDSGVSILQYGSKSAMWTGGANNGGNALTPGNWTVRNGAGMTVSGGLPDSETPVIVSGDNVNLQIPAGSTFQCASLTIQDCTLTADCDWRGLTVTPTIAGTANLNGHYLHLNNLTAVSGSALSNTTSTDSDVRFDSLYDGTYRTVESQVVTGLANLTTSEKARIVILKGDSGTYTTSSAFNVGNTANEWTEFRLTSGTFSQTASQLNMFTVANGHGIFTVDGADVTVYALNVPSVNNAGTATINVNSGNFAVMSWSDFGRSSSAVCTINQTGGTVEVGKIRKDTNSGNGNFWFGRLNSGTATYNMSEGTFTSYGSFRLGSTGSGKGIFNQTGGTVNITGNQDFSFGYDAGSSGKYYQTGGTLNTKRNIDLRRSGALLDIGGAVTSTANGIGVNIATVSGESGEVILREGGVLNTSFLKKGSGTAYATFDGGTIKAHDTNNAGTFISGIGDVKYTAKGLTVDTNGKNVSMVNNTVTLAAPGSAVNKAGTGTLTVDALPPTDGVNVNAGTLALSANCDNTTSGLLAHRWSFNEADETANLTDAVDSTVVAEKIGSNIAFTGGEAVMSGNGNSTGSLNLGTGIFAGNDATIEIWATRTGTPNWARLFDYGSDTVNYMIFTWNYGTSTTRTQFIIRKAGSDKVGIDGNYFSNNVKYHIVVTVNANADGTSTVRMVRRNVADSSDVKQATFTSQADWTLANLSGCNFYLGHSQFSSDKDANAKYDEVRIWNAALNDEAIALSYAKGPNASDGDIAAIAAANSRTLAVASGATLDLGGHTLTQPRLTGVGTVQNGTLDVGTLTPGGDGTAGTIALNVTSVSGVIRIDNGDTFTTTTAGLDLSGATIDLATTPTRSFVVGTASGSGSFAAGRPALTVNGAPLKGWMVKKIGNTLKVSKGGVMIIAK